MAIFRDYNPINHDRGEEDRRRHRKLIEDSIKKNMVDILSEESIIGERKNKKIKVSIKALKEYSFVYGKNQSYIGSGTGREKRGEKKGGKGQCGSSQSAGNNQEEDIYETEVIIEDIVQYIFEDLDLPNLNKKKVSEVLSVEKCKKNGYKKYGIPPRLAKKRTVIEKLKRKQGMKRALKEKCKLQKIKEDIVIQRFPFKKEDLRYYRIKPKEKKEYNAAAIFIMDTSASMDQNKKYLARSFFFMMYQLIKRKYSSVEVVFIAHSTSGKVVNENEFFHKVESGGTYISSGYCKAIEVINKKYDPMLWNIYSFHVSDGDNWSEDNEKALEAAEKLCKLSSIFGYTEIMAYGYVSATKKMFSKLLNYDNFISVTMKSKEDLWNALKEILAKEVSL